MDRRIIILLILFLIVFEFQYIYLPNKKKLNNLNALILKKEKEYLEFLDLCDKYKKNEIEKSIELKVAQKNFLFFSYLNDLIDKFNIRTNVENVKILPSEDISQYIIEKIQIDINLITLEQLLSLIDRIEKTKGIYIMRFEMRRDKDKPYLLDISMILSCLKQKNGVP